MTTADSAERAKAIGGVAIASGSLELTLRMAFCALLGSKYAAVVAGGQGVAWLIEGCRAIAKAHREIGAEEREKIISALNGCSELIKTRNVVIHGAWLSGADFDVFTSKRNTHAVVEHLISVEEIEELSVKMTEHADRLRGALWDAFGGDSAIEAQLRYEEWLDSIPPDELTEMIQKGEI